MFTRFSMMVLICVATLIGGVAMADITINNHSFEDDGAFEWPGGGDISDWNQDGGVGITYNDDGGHGQNAGAAPDGTYFAFIQMGGYVEQSLNDLQHGEIYILRFHARERDGMDPMDLTVSLGTEVLHYAGGFAPGSWTEIAVDFTFDDAWGDTLNFDARLTPTEGDGSLLLDNVRIEIVKTPLLLDAGTDGVEDEEPLLSHSFPFEAPAGEDRLLIVTTGTRDSAGAPERVLPVSVTFVADATPEPMILGRDRISPHWEMGRTGASLWFLPIGDAATPQNATITVEFDESDNAGGIIGWSVFSNIDQDNPRGTVPKSRTAGGETAVHSTGNISSVPQEWVVVSADTGRDALTVDSVHTGQQLIYDTTAPPENILHASSYRVATGTPTETVNMQITASDESPWAMVGVAFKGVEAVDGLGGGESESNFELTYTGLNPLRAALDYQREITVTPQNHIGTVTYQWYRLDANDELELLEGEVFDTLVFDPVVQEDEGRYMCEGIDDHDLSVAQSVVITMNVVEGMPVASTTALALLAAGISAAGLLALRRRRD